jgi:fructokinase
LEKKLDLLCIGELIIDFIGKNKNKSLSNTKNFTKLLGGSPVNVAINTSNLGLKSGIVASIGDDELGEFALKKIKKTSINLEGFSKKENYNTSIILVSKTDQTPQFIPYRNADYQIDANQISENLIISSKILHTTCFALSKNPAQETILNAAKIAFQNHVKLSIDLNYSCKIWGNQESYLPIIKEFLSYNPLVKISKDDCFRLFKKELSETEIFDFFHQSGVEMVCLTKGSEGVSLSYNYDIIHKKAPYLPIIIDATGAGDAFWSGFLIAYLQNKNWEYCIENGQKIASMKLRILGHLKKIN